MSAQNTPKIINAITTSLLFDMREPNQIFREQGTQAYQAHMIKYADIPLPLGPYFDEFFTELQSEYVEFILCSRNDPITAYRAINTLAKHDLVPEQFLFTGGKSPIPFLQSYDIDCFYTTNQQDANDASDHGLLGVYHPLDPHAPANNNQKPNPQAPRDVIPLPGTQPGSVRNMYNGAAQKQVIFDIDGVIVDQEGEKFFQENGHNVHLYHQREKELRHLKMNPGPAYKLWKKYQHINAQSTPGKEPFIISIVTARGSHAAVRALETFHQDGDRINGTVHCMAGKPKEPVLKIIAALSAAQKITCEFLDDQGKNVKMGTRAGIRSGHVAGFDKIRKDLS